MHTEHSDSWNDKLSYILRACGYDADCRRKGGLSENIGDIKGNTMHRQLIRCLQNLDANKLLITILCWIWQRSRKLSWH